MENLFISSNHLNYLEQMLRSDLLLTNWTLVRKLKIFVPNEERKTTEMKGKKT